MIVVLVAVVFNIWYLIFYFMHIILDIVRSSAIMCRRDPFRLSMQNHNLIATVSIHEWDFGSSTDAWSSNVQTTLGLEVSRTELTKMKG